MAKMKLTLAPLPDFKLPVKFVLPDGNEQKIVFTVKHKKPARFKSFTRKKVLKILNSS
ncbi:tail length tape measure protein [Salmonella phage 36]|uniref:Uncharacterized protein n=1 Tax=Salmonella phage 36 TaxID=1654889 RepID=A0A0N7CA33_9CAUD|nr:tail length tape measure protein [Salmonella phage 36]AKJ74003.1 hypothetical protein SP36_31 [Salmonella phage 36]